MGLSTLGLVWRLGSWIWLGTRRRLWRRFGGRGRGIGLTLGLGILRLLQSLLGCARGWRDVYQLLTANSWPRRQRLPLPAGQPGAPYGVPQPGPTTYGAPPSGPSTYGAPQPGATSATPPSPNHEKALAMFDMVRSLFKRGDYSLALAQVNKAVALVPDDSLMHEFRRRASTR